MDVAGNSHELKTRVTQQIERLLATDLLRRSDPLRRLLEYLARRSDDEDIPKEYEIAHEVFGRDGSFDVTQDATIRVYIHRLRKKLEEFYVRNPDGDRLTIPRGTYRLVLVAHDAPVPDAIKPVLGSAPPAPARLWPWIILGFAALALVATLCTGIGYGWALHRDYPWDQARNSLWRPFAGGKQRGYIILGDQLAADGKTRLVSSGSVQPLANLVPLLNALAAAGIGPPPVTTTGRMSPYMIKENNLVYIGTLGQMGILHDLVFEHSGFVTLDDPDVLIDRQTQHRYVADPIGAPSQQVTSYGYLACLDGPSGNRMVIVSGNSDASLLQMAELVEDPKQVDALSAKGGASFEALFAVRTLNGVNVEHHLQLVRPMNGRVAPAMPR